MSEQQHLFNMQPIKTGAAAIEESIRSADTILRLPGAFIRQTDQDKYPYEAVAPGDWTKFKASGLRAEAFELMLRRG